MIFKLDSIDEADVQVTDLDQVFHGPALSRVDFKGVCFAHWGRDKMVDIFLTKFWNTGHGMKSSGLQTNDIEFCPLGSTRQ